MTKIEKRNLIKEKNVVKAKIKELKLTSKKKIINEKTELALKLLIIKYLGLNFENQIYYPHSETIAFNWLDNEIKISEGKFDNFVSNLTKQDLLTLPHNIKFELKGTK